MTKHLITTNSCHVCHTLTGKSIVWMTRHDPLYTTNIYIDIYLHIHTKYIGAQPHVLPYTNTTQVLPPCSLVTPALAPSWSAGHDYKQPHQKLARSAPHTWQAYLADTKCTIEIGQYNRYTPIITKQISC